ncbi:sensor histidine kinase [Aliihoeflea sp. PC F10.4]
MSRNNKKSMSLRWRFTLGFVTLQICAIAFSLALVFYIASDIEPDGAIPSIWLAQHVADSIHVDADGTPELVPTESLMKMMQDEPKLWFVADLPDGTVLSHGDIPAEVAPNVPLLRTFRSVELHGYVDDPATVARLERLETPAGEAVILAGGVSVSLYGLTIMLGNIAVGVPALILVAITLIGVPLVTRWALGSFNDLSGRLDKIDYNARGGVVEGRGLPGEVLPVVDGINMALQRIDSGFETTERFFVNAAHELRTPIAILQVRIDTLPSSSEKTHLQAGIKRLTAIANQLLEIEAYRQKPARRISVDLNAIVAKVVADLAPHAIAEGYEISFDSKARQALVDGDPEALERVFVNLLRNAVQYGGKAGEISVVIEGDGSVLVADQGAGVPRESRARIFEPFYRVNPHGAGAGLGLSMVDEIVTSHGGYVELAPSQKTGSIFAVRWREGRISCDTTAAGST